MRLATRERIAPLEDGQVLVPSGDIRNVAPAGRTRDRVAGAVRRHRLLERANPLYQVAFTPPLQEVI